jgi:Tol biopolymer transport system component
MQPQSSCLSILFATVLASSLSAQVTTRVTYAWNQVPTNAPSSTPAISADGRFIAFASTATNLVQGGGSGTSAVYLYDVAAATTVRASVDSGGTPANGYSDAPAISGDGRYVVFESVADNLVAGDSNGFYDIFVHDMQTGATTRVSVDSSGAQANGQNSMPAISADGRYVAFRSLATNLVAGDTNGVFDVFVHDRQTGSTVIASVDSAGVEGNAPSLRPSLSADGRFLAFYSDATNLVALDSNGVGDVFLRDLQAGTTVSVTADPNWVVGNQRSFAPSVSGDGRYVAFLSDATNLVASDTNGVTDVFVRDMQTGTITRCSVDSSGLQAQSAAGAPSLSSDGRYVAFDSPSRSLVSGDTNSASDVFVHDLQTAATTRASVDSLGGQGNGDSTGPSISTGGAHIAFASSASNLVPGDTNVYADVFVHDTSSPCEGYTTYCRGKMNGHGCTPWICATGTPSISGADDFHVTAHHLLNNKTGLMIWSLVHTEHPFHGGTLCVGVPFHRTPMQNSGGTPGVNDCTGAYSFLFSHAYMASWNLQAGAVVYAQYWYRDPFYPPPDNIGLTDGLQFTVLP